MNRDRRQRGFGILEAIVAMVLLAGTGVALYSWLGTNLRAAGALADASARATLQLRALEVLETVNPAVQPEGALALGQLRLQWRSRATAPSQLSTPSGEPVNWRVGLYRTSVQAKDVLSGVSVQFELTQAAAANLAAPPASGLEP